MKMDDEQFDSLLNLVRRRFSAFRVEVWKDIFYYYIVVSVDEDCLLSSEDIAFLAALDHLYLSDLSIKPSRGGIFIEMKISKR